MADDKKNPTLEQEIEDAAAETIPVMPLNELIARRIEGLAYRVRMGQVIAFDLAWNLGAYSETPHKLCGVMITRAEEIQDEMFDLADVSDTVEKVQRDINKVLQTPKIEVEDRTLVDVIVTPEIEAPASDDDDEDFHLIPDDSDDGEDE
jgi:hypothetical protein